MPLDKYHLEIHSETQSYTRVIGLYLICFYFAEHFLILFFLGKKKNTKAQEVFWGNYSIIHHTWNWNLGCKPNSLTWISVILDK